MWVQETDPFGNLLISALVASVPVLLLFYCLAVRRMKGYHAVIIALATAFATAVGVYGMPVQLALQATAYGTLVGLFPIGWIVLNAVFLYNLTQKTGQFAIVKDSISSVTGDRRLQAILIIYCFGAFLEGAAGFGAPEAIAAAMLVGLGFNPVYAAGLCLLVNTAPVAFGGIGITVITAGKVADLDPLIISRMLANQVPLLSFITPFYLVYLMSGWKGTREVFPAVLLAAVSFSAMLWLTATKTGPMLPSIVSSLFTMVLLILFLKVWRPARDWRFPGEPDEHIVPQRHSPSALISAWMPFLFLILLIGSWCLPLVKNILESATMEFVIRGLHQSVIVAGEPVAAIYRLNWLSAAGTAILLSSMLAAAVLRVSPRMFFNVYKDTAAALKYPLLTISLMLGFAYLTNYSGITPTLGKAITVTGSLYLFLSPFLGWLGVFITGSNTSSNALFCNMQRIAAEQMSVNPVLTVASNISGGVAGKMISPQSIAVACGSVNLAGKEAELFRFTIRQSIVFTLLFGIVCYLQANYFTWMIPGLTNVVNIINSGMVHFFWR